jgi:uncharacterized membrane protein
MTALILGLLIFLATHSVRIYADAWRTAQIASKGELAWKAIYSLVTLVGLVLLVWGYGQTRIEAVDLWTPPMWTHYVAAMLMLIAFVCIAAAYVRGNHLKEKFGHPMVAGVKTWAFAHLIANGRLGDVILFGALLVWSIADFHSSRQRDRAAGTQYPAGTVAADAIVVVTGVAAWLVFVAYLHRWLIGVAPF